MSLVTLTSWILLAADFVGIAQQRADEALPHRLECDDVLAVGQHHAPDRDLVHLADHGEGVVSDLPVRTDSRA
jgi:hypothetical protein